MRPIAVAALLVFGASANEPHWDLARARGRIYQESGIGASRLLKGWYTFQRDPDTGLYSKGKVWNYENEAADHYGSLVPIAYFVDPGALEENGTLRNTLRTAARLCATASGIPAPYDLVNKKKLDPGPGQESRIVFGASEWVKDGLVRIVETMGTDNEWFSELISLTDAIMAWDAGGRIQKELPHNLAMEVSGNMLQTLGRVYAMTGDEKYLRWAEGIADRYLLGNPIAAIKKIGLTDHGNEIVVGLGELFVLEAQLKRPKAAQYEPGLRKLLDRILEIGRDPQTGLWYFSADLETGQVRDIGQLPHAWGYVFFVCENYDRGTGQPRYQPAIEKAMLYLLRNRPQWRHWDNWSDSYESMIILWKRYTHLPRVFSWLHFMTERHRSCWMEQYGPYSGDHDDGSTGRRLVLHMMLASQGVRAIPYSEKVRVGAMEADGELFLTAESEVPWEGRLCFDWPRSEHKAATLDWARINESPEWFTVRPGKAYSVQLDGAAAVKIDGRDLIRGLRVQLNPGTARRLRVRP